MLQLKGRSEAIWSACLELSSKGYEVLPKEISEALTYIQLRIAGNESAQYVPIKYDGESSYIKSLAELINDTVIILNDKNLQFDKQIIYRKPMYSQNY